MVEADQQLAPRQRRGFGRFLKAIGWVLVVIGAFGVMGVRSDDFDLTQKAISLGIGLAAGGTGAAILTRGRQHTALTAEELLARDPRPPVVYLRSFEDDRVAAAQHTGSQTMMVGRTEEEQLAKVLTDIGPVVAVGRPGDKLPELGAARMYVSDADWQEKVTALLVDAELVALRGGISEGFLWELQTSTRVLVPERLILLIPHDEATYAQFVAAVGGLFPRGLPVYDADKHVAGSLAGLVYFQPDWSPVFVGFRRRFVRSGGTNPVEAMFRRALEPVFHQLGARWTKPKVGWFRVYAAFMLTIGVITLAGIGIALWQGWIEP